jgi:hypothetical protein
MTDAGSFGMARCGGYRCLKEARSKEPFGEESRADPLKSSRLGPSLGLPRSPWFRWRMELEILGHKAGTGCKPQMARACRPERAPRYPVCRLSRRKPMVQTSLWRVSLPRFPDSPLCADSISKAMS